MKGYDDLILRVDFGSDGPDLIWRAGRRRLTPAADSAVARGERLAGAGGSSATGGLAADCLVEKKVRATRNPKGCTGRRFWARPRLAVARCGPGHSAVVVEFRWPVHWHLGWSIVYQCGRKRESRSGGGLPKLGAGGDVTPMSWRRGWAEALVGACGPGCGSGAGAGKRAGDAPGPQAELWKRLSVAGVRRSGGNPAERGALHGGAWLRAEIWVWAAAAWCGRVQGGSQGPI